MGHCRNWKQSRFYNDWAAIALIGDYACFLHHHWCVSEKKCIENYGFLIRMIYRDVRITGSCKQTMGNSIYLSTSCV